MNGTEEFWRECEHVGAVLLATDDTKAAEANLVRILGIVEDSTQPRETFVTAFLEILENPEKFSAIVILPFCMRKLLYLEVKDRCRERLMVDVYDTLARSVLDAYTDHWGLEGAFEYYVNQPESRTPLPEGQPVRYRDKETLMVAAETGDVETIRKRLTELDILARRDLVFQIARQALCHHQFHVVDWLLSEVFDVDECDNHRSQTLLESAAELGDFEAVKFMLEKGAAVNRINRCGTSILHTAIGGESLMANSQEPGARRVAPSDKITRLLIRHGADVNTKDSDGKTPLDWAIELGHRPAEKLLRASGGRDTLSSKDPAES